MVRVRITDDTQIMAWLARLRQSANHEYATRETALLKNEKGVKSATLPAPGGGKLFEVVGIPLPEPGFHVVELESERLGAALLAKPKRAPNYKREHDQSSRVVATPGHLGRAEGQVAHQHKRGAEHQRLKLHIS